MNASTAPSTPRVSAHAAISHGTSNCGTILGVATRDSGTGPRYRSTTSTRTGSSQRELAVKQLSGKRGAHQNPPRERPSAWASCPLSRSSCSIVPRSGPLSPRPSGMLVSAGDGGVDGDHLQVQTPERVVLDLHALQQAGPGSILVPAFPPLVTGLPGPVPLRDIPPRRPGPQPPQNPVDHLAVIPPPPPPPIDLRQQRLDPGPRHLGQLTTSHHKRSFDRNQPTNDDHLSDTAKYYSRAYDACPRRW